MSSENPNELKSEIHSTLDAGVLAGGTLESRIAALASVYPTGDSQNYHMFTHIIQELNRKLDQFGFADNIVKPIDAGFRPLNFDDFFIILILLWEQLGQDIDGEAALDQSGRSVSINAAGNRVAIGATLNDGNGSSSGHTRIYEYSNGTWSQLGQDIDGEAAGDYSGYSVSMNAAGNRVAIGAPYNDGNGGASGHTRIYEYDDITQEWAQLGQDIDGEAANDYSGYSVSINADGDRVAIGAVYNYGTGEVSGHTRIYEYSNGTWSQLGLDIDGEAFLNFSGWSVIMNDAGNRVAIGAPYNDANGYASGHTRIYEYSNGTWTQLGQDIDGEATEDQSGSSVSMNAAGDRIAIGATENDGSGFNSGHTRIYEYDVNAQAWVQLGSDIDGESAYDQSGYSVSMNAAGDRVAIGAYLNDGNGNSSGHTRIYEYGNGAWSQLGDDIDGEDGNDLSGYSVSMNDAGDRVAIGAISNDGNGSQSGHTRIYKLTGEKLLRKFGGASVGYSLRDLYGNSANVVRVRRSTDNAERDFTASQISSGEMVNWVTAQSATANGFVSIWYDQSGNGYDAREPNVTYQPKIVDAGNLVTDTNGRAAINGKSAKFRLGHFDWRGESPREMLSNDGTHSTFMVCDLPDQTLGSASPFNTFVDVKSTSASIRRRPLIYLRISDGTLAARTSDGNSPYGVEINAATAQSAQLITDIVNPSGTNQQEKHSFYVDGAFAAEQNFNSAIPFDSNTTLSENSVLFDRAETVQDTYISEFIYYPSDQSINRAGIEANILNYYNI